MWQQIIVDALDSCLKIIYEQRYLAQKNKAGEKMTFYVTSKLHEQFVTSFICHIKANMLAFQQLYLPHKNCPI
jgi:hypothetical protein